MSKKKTTKKLAVKSEKLRKLTIDTKDLGDVAGGAGTRAGSYVCPTQPPSGIC